MSNLLRNKKTNNMKCGLLNKEQLKRLAGIILLFGIIAWSFYLHLPVLNEGYLNAGDNHIHVAFSNELKRIWQDEGRFLGWSRLYATGAPIFLLRPPGFYAATCLVHFLTGLTVEQSLKIVVIFGFCLYPLSMYIGGRLLGLGFMASVFAGLLSPLVISLWGHTLDAYQYLGVHKQLIAILVFPPAAGALWRLLKEGEYGLVFAVLFPIMFVTHPYIAYCFALLVPCMFITLLTTEPQWNWKLGLRQTVLWSIPAVLFLCLWLIPFVSSQEIQVIDPYLSRRKDFDVVGCTTAETLRQFILGGILDTTRFAGTFGGSDWIGGNEWGWLNNSALFRLPILTALTFIGLLVVLIRPKYAVRGFLGLAFLLATLLFIGPDDFPILNWIPFAKKFQNIHAIFIFEWAAIMLGGVACQFLFSNVFSISKNKIKYSIYVLIAILIIFAYGSAVYERTKTGKRLNDVLNLHTENGELTLRTGMFHQWRKLIPVVRALKKSKDRGNIVGFPLKHNDSMTYNLLPLMVDRPVFISGFELVGGVYDLLLHKFRTDLRDNYNLQKLFNIRFAINSPFYRKKEMIWHGSVEKIHRDKFWELVKIKGNFGELEPIPLNFIGFVGTEREWASLMELWLRNAKKEYTSLPWIINLTHAGLKARDIYKIKPFMKGLILGDNASPPDFLIELEKVRYNELGRKTIDKLKALGAYKKTDGLKDASYDDFKYEALQLSRSMERFRVNIKKQLTPLLFKRTFYRGWEARIDGEKTPIYRISPGMQMVLVPAGKHIVTWHYTGPNRWFLARSAFWLALIISGILLWKKPIN